MASHRIGRNLFGKMNKGFPFYNKIPPIFLNTVIYNLNRGLDYFGYMKKSRCRNIFPELADLSLENYSRMGSIVRVRKMILKEIGWCKRLPTSKTYQAECVEKKQT